MVVGGAAPAKVFVIFMADEKKGFILYADYLSLIKKLVLKDREENTNNSGELFLIILEYVNDLNPEPLNFTIELVFEQIKAQLKRDLVKYEHIKAIRSELGKKGAEVKKQNKAKEAIANLAEAKQAVNVNDNVSVNVNVIKEEEGKFELHKIFYDKLLKDEAEIEAIEYQTKIKINEDVLKGYNYHLFSEKRLHVRYEKYCVNLRNWLTKKPEIKNGTQTPQTPRRSTKI